MKHVRMVEAEATLSGLVDEVEKGGEVVITRHGKPVAAVIGIDDLEALEAFETARDRAEFEAAKRADDGGRVPLAELRNELDR